MFPRLVCHSCQVLWTDLGDDWRCWVCAKPGARTGETVLAPGTHRYEPARRIVVSRAIVWAVDQEERAPW